MLINWPYSFIRQILSAYYAQGLQLGIEERDTHCPWDRGAYSSLGKTDVQNVKLLGLYRHATCVTAPDFCLVSTPPHSQSEGRSYDSKPRKLAHFAPLCLQQVLNWVHSLSKESKSELIKPNPKMLVCTIREEKTLSSRGTENVRWNCGSHLATLPPQGGEAGEKLQHR